ncbi:hypothetical protein OHA72_37575 [Dactylosporangium sp. NBC_01737]|nr:hypothetical protein OHA72_37575 [Dactylosporangium sp. NBC_01737]
MKPATSRTSCAGRGGRRRRRRGVAGGGGRRGGALRRDLLTVLLAAQDALVQLLQLLAGLDAQLVGEDRPHVVVFGEHVGLPAQPQIALHEHQPQPLPQRVAAGQPEQLTDEVGVLAQLQQDLRPVLHRDQPQLTQPGALGGDERAGGAAVGRAPPQRERAVELTDGAVQRTGAVQPPGLGQVLLEAPLVDLPRRKHQHVAGALRQQHLRRRALRPGRLQRAAQAPHVRVDAVDRGRRRVDAPDRVDQLLAADDPPGVGGEGREQGELPRRTEVDVAPSGADGDRTEQPDLRLLDPCRLHTRHESPGPSRQHRCTGPETINQFQSPNSCSERV